ncbi:sensor histidine kinase NtrY-like [Acetobacter syzygii]|uniref:histidine kinase n=1 Tax=Acetobacter syzygii TaxID=146476 RepID=A0A270BPV4_9PROT|nr:PAS domain-containing sensor histidine kinase [Acetobacter syzygii]NSL93266.1 PAS domain-containing sensor histidine kinase [Acetobacter syzygii]PAL26186.1 two-component sensor histidine kinase [Acetobacter syzygii]PAL26343.1 two-component sensor histidine kinase [Acetobacter syzygii]
MTKPSRLSFWHLFSRTRLQWLLRALERRSVAITLAALALCLVFATFVVLSGGMSFGHYALVEPFVLVVNGLVLLLLLLAMGVRGWPILVEYRKGLAGTRLHVRLVTLFGIVAVAPTVVVGVFATLFFHYGIQIWFSDRVNTALNEALQASRGYLQEHNANIRTDAFSMSNYIMSAQNELAASGMQLLQDHDALSQMLDSQATMRGLTEALVYDPITNRVVAAGGLMSRTGYLQELPPPAATLMARSNDVAILDSPDERTVRAVVELSQTPTLMLVITRLVDPSILEHMHRTEKVVADYKHLNSNKAKIQLTFVMIFVLVALLVLAVAAFIGFALANQIARPLGLLSMAARRVSEGDLRVHVPETNRDDEVASLSRAFNRMTEELDSQRSELMLAYGQINERRRFTEAVLSGVSAGVIGLDVEQRIELPNRAASVLLQTNLADAIGEPLATRVPEFAELLAEITQSPETVFTREIQIGLATSQRTLLVRVGAELRGTVTEGYVMTFDDITALQQAQRKAAWADVARRIAHEIKNPLTPIQLAAERLKRRFLKEITSDPDTFAQCADTIVRQVGDIGRMVDEFSAFARMPQPIMKNENLSRIAQEVLILQRNAHHEITYHLDLPEHGPMVRCDRRLISQALINLLQNAADAIAMANRPDSAAEQAAATKGEVWVRIAQEEENIAIVVADNGVGLPVDDRNRLTEPYVTHKAKGTGLGLAIVKKIMEDHGGTVRLEDRSGEKGTVATLVLPVKDDHGA